MEWYMRQLTFLKPGKLEWREVPEPRLESDGDALVEPIAVARCDLDLAILKGEAPFRNKLLHWIRNHAFGLIRNTALGKAPFRGPYPFGHEFVAEVKSVGDRVRSVKPGDKVIVAFQIACGSCNNCKAGLTNSCISVPPRSMYGFGDLGGKHWGGAFSDLVRVPFADFMLIPLPKSMSPSDAASMSDNIPDGYRTVGPFLKKNPGAPVLVVGGGAKSVGLYSVMIAKSMGSSVTYVDNDLRRIRIASDLGAEVIQVGGSFPEPDTKYPITVDASAHPDGLSFALRSLLPGGHCTSVGIYYTKKTSIPLLEMYGRGVSFSTGRVNVQPTLHELLHLSEHPLFCPCKVTQKIASWEEAVEALFDDGPKVVVERL
ncbi:alcohol dehydrogenase [Leptospira gomenensis]|uniref:Alcohol dehydrogenase n=2 Tax=Leptospira gomenensis TaxID=2484974 RepID=A0A5F1YAT5_9LEPT|nr:alcohol dehydrogenase [Leptospira gomenensis]TGK40166.1 alcohol dehydrogenase [Leptospira gomenensis]TGK41909.1 alcohol dehydrogenase [Leptospira gomenensis]TGK55675.1 alcohol dehydrogenase [Leptospira gomenensis]